MTDKKLEELTPEEFKDLKIEFAPGCFDNFEGSQEELDELVNQIKEMFSSGEAQRLARPIDLDDLDDDDIDMLNHFSDLEEKASGRKLQ